MNPSLALWGGLPATGESDTGEIIGIAFGVIILIAAYIWWTRMMDKD
jgi:LPXTG-motif cell wall-anchored protein